MKKILIIASIIIGIVGLSVVGYGFYLFKTVKDTASEMHEPIEREKTRLVDFDSREPLSFLLTGVDSSGDEIKGRSDTIIVMTVNPNEKSVKMLSIPRDTRTEIIGRGTQDKINHAYAFGGVSMTMDTVENFLGIPIDHYISVNMEGFKDIVDAVGGVKVENTFSFNYEGFNFPQGELFLNGEKALAYSRMRYDDPRGDFGRNDRQRQVIHGIIQEGAQISSITRLDDMLRAIGNSVKTDLDFDAMNKIQSKYREARHSVEEIQITGSGTRINGIYYLIVPDEEIARVSNELKEHLEIN
ncbi:LCP family glycopolymer transferase [Alkalihalobacterium chitinilyticum]|uniref:Polyisoprenyl-teichoic acid--peptidoglycan teichoic acid transferase TagU n=1 Tax=Alkalihalobacterium chitinilyticum TaxID=2980103 RepID=A0ABT5VK52_9BACI|nr:LCP family protein [Alkalihalobacterium chitinilyticum]MDE5415833.1 LCP family protein [Alkalihalobacterium chitinilyticum]